MSVVGPKLNETPFCRPHFVEITCSPFWVPNFLYKMGCRFNRPSLQNGLEFFFNHFDGKDAFSTKWVASPFQKHIQHQHIWWCAQPFCRNQQLGVHTHFVVDTPTFTLQNGVHNPTWWIGRGMFFLEPWCSMYGTYSWWSIDSNPPKAARFWVMWSHWKSHGVLDIIPLDLWDDCIFTYRFSWLIFMVFM